MCSTFLEFMLYTCILLYINNVINQLMYYVLGCFVEVCSHILLFTFHLLNACLLQSLNCDNNDHFVFILHYKMEEILFLWKIYKH